MSLCEFQASQGHTVKACLTGSHTHEKIPRQYLEVAMKPAAPELRKLRLKDHGFEAGLAGCMATQTDSLKNKKQMKRLLVRLSM